MSPYRTPGRRPPDPPEDTHADDRAIIAVLVVLVALFTYCSKSDPSGTHGHDGWGGTSCPSNARPLIEP